MTRSPLQEVARAAVMAVALVVAFTVPFAGPLAAAFLGVRIAYDPPQRRGTGAVVLLLIAAELLWGLDLGILSLPFLATVIVAALAGRLFALRPWSDADGWRMADAFRSAVIAVTLGAATVAASVLVSTAYGNGRASERFRDAFAGSALPVLAAGTVLSLAVMRRIDVPWRQPVRFGS